VVAELEQSSGDVGDTEDIVVSQWSEVSADVKHQLRQKVDEILRPLGLQTRLLVVERADKLVPYFSCLTLSSVVSLRDQFNNGQLQDILEDLFTVLSGFVQPVYLKRISWPAAQFHRCLDFFSAVQGL